MPTVTSHQRLAHAYLAEASAWDKLDGRIPGEAGHNPSLWAAWLSALRAASQLTTALPVKK